MSTHFSFTREKLLSIKPTDRRQYVYDTKEPRLGLYVTPTGHKSWFARIQTPTGMVRRPFGPLESMTLTAARHRAIEVVAGGDPVPAKRRRKQAGVTLAEVLAHYLEVKRHHLKPYTVADYKRAIRETYGDWLERPLAEITEKAILRRHKERGAVSEARTTNAEKVLSALFNFARGAYKVDGKRLFPENPVLIIKELNARFIVKRRRTIVRSEDFGAWWSALQTMPDLPRQLIEFCLFTGCRRTESGSLTWEQTNFRTGTFTLTDTKNRSDIELPLPDRLLAAFSKRRRASGPIFPAGGKTGHLIDVGVQINKIEALCGVRITLHDLRRTFVSTANSLNISAYTVKWLVNHRFEASDVTAGYDVVEIGRLREASRKIEAKLLRLADDTRSNVVQIQAG